MIALALIWLVATLSFSVLAHELGHMVSARLLGWEVHGFVWRWYGVGIAIELKDERDLWITAIGGLGVTALLASIFLWMSEIPGLLGAMAWAACGFNVALLVCNALPIKGLDGGWIVRSLRAHA